MNETDNQKNIETGQEVEQLDTDGALDEQDELQADFEDDLASDDFDEIVYDEVSYSDSDSGIFSFPSIARRISTRTGLYSAFLVLIPLLIASTLAFLNQGASKETQETVIAQLSENANSVADSVQWQLASKLNVLSGNNLSDGANGALLQKIDRELEYQFFDGLYEVAAPLDSSIKTSTNPKLDDVLKEIATPIEAEGGLLYIYDNAQRSIYASQGSIKQGSTNDEAAFAATMLKDFSGERLAEVGEKTTLVSRRSLPAADWQMVMFQPAPAAAMSNRALMRPLAWLTALAPLLALLLGNLWGFFSFQRPLNELRDAVQRLLSGKQTASVPRNRSDELGLLTKEVSLLSQKFSAVVLEEAEPKERLFEAQERIRQQYLRENYPEQFDGEDDVSETDGSETSQFDDGVSNAAVSKAAVAENKKLVEADKVQKEKVKTLTKQSEADKKAIADLEKALEEARASQTTLTESQSKLESQLKQLENDNKNLVSKEKYETELSQLHQHLIDRSKLLKGHIRSAKASAVGFNVADSETNMNAAVQELDELDSLLSNFGESALGIKPKKSEQKADQKIGQKAVVKDKTSKTETNKATKPQNTTAQKSVDNVVQSANTQDIKDLADASKPLQTVNPSTKPENKDTSKSNKQTSTTSESQNAKKPIAKKSVSKKSVAKDTVDQKQIEKQDMLTPLPSVGVSSKTPVVANAIAAKDIDTSHGVVPKVEKSKQPEVIQSEQKNDVKKTESKADSKVPASVSAGVATSETKSTNVTQESIKEEVNVAAIDYDAAIALEIDKHNPNLKVALEDYLQSFKQHTQLQVEGYISSVKLSDQNKVLIRDFVKAAFDNIAQHSDSTSVLLELNPSKDGTKLDLMIVDNGKGFEPDKLSKNSKLEQFKKAFSILNGELMLYSSSNEGTMINASLPLKG